MSRRGVSQQHRWPTWGWALLAAFATLSFSACIDDVVIRECFLKGTCPEAGAGGDGDEPSGGVGGDGGAAGGGGGDLMAGQSGHAGVGPDTCKTCGVLPEHLPPACAGKPYRTTLKAVGGLAPYSWRLASQQNGWTIADDPDRPDSAILRATVAPEAPADLSLVAVDSREKEFAFTLRLEVRSNCWFAYPSLEGGVPELELLDPIVESPQPAPLVHQEGVYDFQFSPDGAFLAYRYGQDAEHPRGRHLSLVDLASLQEHEVSFVEDQVLTYAWAPSSKVLAAAFQKDGKRYLGAARPPLPGSDDSPTSLNSIAAPVDSDLYWVGSDYVVFHAPASVGVVPRTAWYSALTTGGFVEPIDVGRLLDPGLVVQPAATGFFLITPLSTIYHDLSEGGGVDVDQPLIALVSPTGNYTAMLSDNGQLNVFPAATADLGPVFSPADASQTCSRLLAWAPERERIACVVDVSNGDGTSHGVIRFFDLASDAEHLEGSVLDGFCPGDVSDSASECLVKGEGYSYGDLQAMGSARAFSRSGRYFAFARELGQFTYVYFADLETTPLRVAEPIRFGSLDTNTSPLGFLFSPDERFLLVRRGPWLSVIELETGRQGGLTDVLALADACSEEFVAGPQSYCGNAIQAGVAEWAPDSRSLAFRTTEGLTIIDLSPFPTKDVKVLPAVECAAACSGQFGFQP